MNMIWIKIKNEFIGRNHFIYKILAICMISTFSFTFLFISMIEDILEAPVIEFNNGEYILCENDVNREIISNKNWKLIENKFTNDKFFYYRSECK